MGLKAAIQRRVAAWLFKRAVRKVVKMTGWKTRLGGIGMIAAGIAQIAAGLASNNWDEVTKGALAVAAGFAALGIGHKQDKVVEAVREASRVSTTEAGGRGPTDAERDKLLNRK